MQILLRFSVFIDRTTIMKLHSPVYLLFEALAAHAFLVRFFPTEARPTPNLY
jgi:hypothetical protein